jgi:hypothetical protein
VNATVYNIVIVNFATLFDDKDLPAVANAAQLHMTRDVDPMWGTKTKIWYTPRGMNPTPGHWVVGIFDDATQAGALGFHDVGVNNEPLGKVFMKASLADGVKISTVITHEIPEMAGDPAVNGLVEVLHPTLGLVELALENADAVENQSYDVTIPAGWAGAGQVIPVSNVVSKAWFQPGWAGPYDIMGSCTAPLQLTPGGYISYRIGNGPWQQLLAREITSPGARMQARPYVGSRRALRSIPVKDRIPSDYTPGDTAVPAEAA